MKRPCNVASTPSLTNDTKIPEEKIAMRPNDLEFRDVPNF
jgi:hypothetical protein